MSLVLWSIVIYTTEKSDSCWLRTTYVLNPKQYVYCPWLRAHIIFVHAIGIVLCGDINILMVHKNDYEKRKKNCKDLLSGVGGMVRLVITGCQKKWSLTRGVEPESYDSQCADWRGYSSDIRVLHGHVRRNYSDNCVRIPAFGYDKNIIRAAETYISSCSDGTVTYYSV